ncbi:RHS repeat-associated core domain-containing protein [Pseudomonas sp. Pseusp122]|uniref:RHS repeat-associated core domain-containing protein n=1 Tax=unclassified Pseudomonas TaxID=196821 RepID=UPI0039A61969
MNATYTPLCRYQYDPLDRLATCSPAEQNGIQRCYHKKRLTTEIQGQIQRAFFQTEDQLLAQHQGPKNCTLLASDQQRSVLDGINDAQRQSTSYTPYGGHHPQTNALGLLGFTGERADPVTGHYLLGNGYRAFNPTLMRFNSPDSLSPFGEAGLNAYAYCRGDPVNRVDPTGHTWAWIKPILRAVNLMKPSGRESASNITGVDIKSLPNQDKTLTTSSKPVSNIDTKPNLEVKTLQGSVSSRIDQRINEVNSNFNTTPKKAYYKLTPLEQAKYTKALDKAKTLSRAEEKVLILQMRPLPQAPSDPVLSRSSFRKINRRNSQYKKIEEPPSDEIVETIFKIRRR